MADAQKKKSNKWKEIGLPLGIAVVLSGLGWYFFPPVMPHIQLPAEPVLEQPLLRLGGIWGDIYLTNTLVATLLIDVVLLGLVWAVQKAARSGDLIPRGISGVLEATLEAIYNLTETTAGKWTETIFPYFATFFLVVLIANWTELLPGVDSIGWLHHVEEGVKGFGHVGPFLMKKPGDFQVMAWVRVASTDLNFTIALALVSVFMTQVIGVRALGLPYFKKFFNIEAIFKVKPMYMGVIDFFVSILEIISEVAKIISFSFRLFGNLFAGSVMLFVLGYLVPILLQSGVLLLEAFVGIVQALVFGMLTLMFMALATHPHGGEEHGEAHA